MTPPALNPSFLTEQVLLNVDFFCLNTHSAANSLQAIMSAGNGITSRFHSPVLLYNVTVARGPVDVEIEDKILLHDLRKTLKSIHGPSSESKSSSGDHLDKLYLILNTHPPHCATTRKAMQEEAEQPGASPSSPKIQALSEHVRVESESNDNLVVSSIPIFVMEDNSTDEDELSGQRAGGSTMSESAGMDVTKWISGSGDREEIPIAANFVGDADDTVLFESPSRSKDASEDDELNSGEDSISRAAKKSNGCYDSFILEDRYAGEGHPNDSYVPLPGPFGELIHYSMRVRSISDGGSNRSVREHIDMTRDLDHGITFSVSTDVTGEDDTPDQNTVDEFWMESLVSLPWVKSDMTMIFDVESKRMVPMPQRRLERKKAVIDLYSFIIKGVWLVQLAAVGDWMERIFPVELWWGLFTEKESEELQHATRTKIRYEIITRAITVTEEWRLRCGFPKVPETVEELIDARRKARERYDLKVRILIEASDKSVDRWVKYVFQGIMETENLDRILGHNLPGIRQCVVSKLIHATEFPFEDCWTVTRSLEVPLANRRKMEDVLEEQVNGPFQNLNIHDE
ncbi:hypothetical protein BKA65DRAFT_472057 [Rhexocercosporidium sp. MPI-PUGE-AT-0058]|nr:hypothetical protein BKA65DRAFT_472057 [Rhexocercosporidium sp. MPI-PUGE-AT-0058]